MYPSVLQHAVVVAVLVRHTLLVRYGVGANQKVFMALGMLGAVMMCSMMRVYLQAKAALSR